MKLNEFINKYIGTKVDFDGVYGAQCVDLFRQYCKDVLNIPHTGAVGGAIELYTKYDLLPVEKKYFDKVYKTIYSGDVVIFNKTEKNEFGHVAIVLGECINGLLVFEQDGFAQDGAKISIWSKNNVAGYLRFKGTV